MPILFPEYQEQRPATITAVDVILISIVSGGICHIDSSFLRVDQDTMKLIYAIFVLGAVAFAAPSVQDANTDTGNPCHFTPCTDFPMCKPDEVEIGVEPCGGTYLAKALCCEDHPSS
jgi:hypothetical protein